jgi:cytochrome c553
MKLALPVLVSALVAAGACAAPDFDRAVAPILTACLDCHSGSDAAGKLDLSRKRSALAAIVPGKPGESELWKRVTADEMPPKKPLTADEKAVLKAWIEGGANWGTDPVDPLAYTTKARAGRDWWALAPVRRPDPPQVAGREGHVTNPIDAFVLARLEKDGLKPSPPADRRTVIRRLKFDLLGLPPTPQEVEAFVNDRSADAYEKLADRYLASPQYGERWARHWLDVVRFAESHGFETNTVRANSWPYRDWVIKALNDDLPYDRFVFEQLAGDTVGRDAATGFLVAGAWDAVQSPDPVLTANQRADELHDIVSTVGATFLGLTVGCARCHTHKFDPIPQLDYYRLKAAFAGVQHGEREVRTGDPAVKAKLIETLRTELTTVEAAVAKLEPLADAGAIGPQRVPVHPRMNVERFTPVRAKYVRMVIATTNNLEPCVDEFEVFTAAEKPKNVAMASAGAKATSAGDYPNSDIHRLEYVNDGRYGNGRSWISDTPGRGRLTIELAEAVEIDRVMWGRDREEKFADRLATRYRIDVSADGRSWQVVASSDDRAAVGSAATPSKGLSEAERAEWNTLTKHAAELRLNLAALVKADRAYIGRFAAPEQVHRLHRGDPMEKRERVGPGVLSGVGPSLVIPDKASDAERRAAVAKWITDPANPLTPRVIINRLWQHHFGTGLVATPSDFGFHGGRPSHPELLDWLANELIDHRWSLKHVHRLIVTSATYRQSSASNSDALAKDAGTRLLWRHPPRRLEAEAIRDSILAVSGKLDLTAGGPGFDLFEPNTNYVKVYTPKTAFGPTEFRRMIYQQKPRMQPDDTFGGFDCPDAGQPAPRRNSSATPLQALNLLNSPFVTQQAEFFAGRVKAEANEPVGQVRRAFRLAFQREPSDKELSAAVKLVTDHGLPALCRALLNANEFLYLD